MSNHARTAIRAVLLGAGALALPTTGLAQALSEIVVTARKTEESLQDVPISISAFSAEQIREQGLRDMADISAFTPGFSFERQNRFGAQGGTSRPVIRGQSQILGESNVAVFIDGLQFSDSILSFPFDLVDRVEVIKGPQAALFGRATFAGAINLVTKRPTNEFENQVSVTVADYSQYEGNFLSRGPLIEDRLFYMAHVRYYDFGGFYRNSLDNQRVGNEESKNFNGALEFRPTDEFTARLSLGLGRDDDGAVASTLQNRFENNCFLDVRQQYYCGEVRTDLPITQNLDLFGDDIGIDRESRRVALFLEWATDNFTITSNSGYTNVDQTYGYDVDLTANSTALGGNFNRIAVSDRTEKSSELIVQSSAEQRVRWLGGVYYYNSRRDFREDRLNGNTVDEGEARIDNVAIFGSVSMNLTDAVSASLELRYAEDKIGNNNPVARPTAPLFENKFTSTSPRLTVDWALSDDVLLYASYAQGNKPGFINANPLLPPEFVTADEEKSDNFEIGVKSTFNQGRTLVNAAVYTIDWDKQQLTSNVIVPTGPISIVTNAGRTRVSGFELEATNAFTDNFTAGLGFSYDDAKFRQLDDPEAEALFGDPSVRGKQTPNSPKTQANLFGRYEFDLGAGLNAFVRADYAYTSRKYAQIFNLAHTGDKNIINLRAGLQRDNWTVSAWVNNLTDDRTPSLVIRFLDFENPLPIGDSNRTSPFVRAFQVPKAAKRQFGLTFTYGF
ncbi:MAG: TonB-dependent receptor [Gammaproteobacteria bacterium]|nr:TonB-dependent receptor [Gammaproteobacteria bacterium]